jgi:hypothetical protein
MRRPAHQIFPDISADNPSAATRGTIHTIWWDSRNDSCYSVTRPIGNCANRTTVPSLDAWAARSTKLRCELDGDARERYHVQPELPNFEQFADRTVPFAGDYLYVSSVNDFSYGVWTDWRNTVQGTDPREDPEDEDGQPPTSTSAASSRTERGAATAARGTEASTRTSTTTSRRSATNRRNEKGAP